MLALNTLLKPQRQAEGEAYFITDGESRKLWDFAQSLWDTFDNAGTHTETRIIIPWWVIWALAAVTELVFYIFTLGRMSPPLTRLHIRFMKEGAWFEIKKARERLGYQPLFSMDEGIRRTVAWFNRVSVEGPTRKTD